MISAFNTPISHPYFEISPHTLESSSPAHESLLEKSEIHSLHGINTERFAELNSFSLRNFTFLCQSEDKIHMPFGLEREADHSGLEDPLYNVLSLKRGRSECYFD